MSDIEVGGGTTTDPESYNVLFETDLEAMRRKEGFSASNVQDIDLYDFIPCTEMIYAEERPKLDPHTQLDWTPSPDIELVEVDRLNFPEKLKVMSFPRGSLLNFKSPLTTKVDGISNYFLMDGANILPVISLNLQPNDKVADICAAPGGKALAIMFTMLPSALFCIDKSARDFRRMQSIFDSYIPDSDSIRNGLLMEAMDAADINFPGAFDKVLVDVPSIKDRSVIKDNTKDNIFKISLTDERIKIPTKQQALLKTGLKLVKKGGSVVYSTSTLSPVQNDRIVESVITELTSVGMKFTVDNLKEAYRPLRILYRMHTMTYGIQVLPFLPSNFGPVYFSKINRVE